MQRPLFSFFINALQQCRRGCGRLVECLRNGSGKGLALFVKKNRLTVQFASVQRSANTERQIAAPSEQAQERTLDTRAKPSRFIIDMQQDLFQLNIIGSGLQTDLSLTRSWQNLNKVADKKPVPVELQTPVIPPVTQSLETSFCQHERVPRIFIQEFLNSGRYIAPDVRNLQIGAKHEELPNAP